MTSTENELTMIWVIMSYLINVVISGMVQVTEMIIRFDYKDLIIFKEKNKRKFSK